MLDLSRYRDMMAKCSHCGLCQATCPVYLEDFLQTHLARARMDLIRAVLLEGDLPVTKRFHEVLNRCLLCTHCSKTCAAGVLVDEIVVAARHQLYRGSRRGPLRRYILRRFMKGRGGDWWMVPAGSLAQRVGVLPREVPAPFARKFEKRCQGRIPAKGSQRASVAYFVGCATNSLYPDTGEDVVRVLAHNGIEVLIPDGMVCCGMPALAEGDLATAEEMTRTNVGILAGMGVDAIVTDCTSCGLTLRTKAARALPEGHELRRRAEALSEKVWEVTDYLNHMGLVREPSPLRETVTYHVPCHRGWTPTLNDAPRSILDRIPHAESVELEHPEACCGAGGTFFMEFGELSSGIRAHKVEDIRQTGAKTVLTQCPACRSYLGPSMPDCDVIHPVSLLARAYGLQ
jgi:glycolate oxidase iron-sulfur subunit